MWLKKYTTEIMLFHPLLSTTADNTAGTFLMIQ